MKEVVARGGEESGDHCTPEKHRQQQMPRLLLVTIDENEQTRVADSRDNSSEEDNRRRPRHEPYEADDRNEGHNKNTNDEPSPHTRVTALPG
jgi:hypothetical protein